MPRPLIPERRSRILDAARELALDKGWPAATVAGIAARAGIGKGAIYLEFEDKNAILSALLTRSLRALGTDVHRRVLATADLIDLPTVYRFGTEALLADPLMRAFHIGDASVLGEYVHTVDDDRYRQRFDWLLDYIVGLQRAGVLARDVPRETLARVLSTFTIGLLHAPGTLGPVTDDQLRETVGLFAELVGTGLASGLPPDHNAARAAQLDLLDALERQLNELEES